MAVFVAGFDALNGLVLSTRRGRESRRMA